VKTLRLRMSGNRVLGRVFGSRKEELNIGYRQLHNDEVHNSLCSSCAIIRMIKSRRVRWAAHVERVGKMRNAYKILVGKPEG